MKTRILRFLSTVTATFVLSTAYFGTFPVSAFETGESVGIGTVTSASNRIIEDGLDYSSAVIADKNGTRNHRVQTVTFNPGDSDFIPLVYSQYSGYGSRTINAAKNAETKHGYDVKAGVNASFFVLSGGDIQGSTYGGVNISDGKVFQGCNNYGATWMLTFDSDGKSDLVYSRVAYELKLNGQEKAGALENININPVAGKTTTGIYYSDTSCGTATDTKEPGVEILFNKVDDTELIVGGTLVGEVCEIRSNVSSGNPIGLNQFVLYASDKSPWASALRGLKIGDKAEITCTETMTGAKAAMENCNGALVTYGYHLIENGKNITPSFPLGDDFSKARAQRTAVGIKADGTLILVVDDGRTSEYPGMTLYEMADFLLSQGCVTGISLDGGGSTQMTVENSAGELEAVFSSTRSVANSLLVVKRPSISDDILSGKYQKLSALIAEAETYLPQSAALREAKKVSQSATSMPGDYTRAIMGLQKELNEVEKPVFPTGVTVEPTSMTLTAQGETFQLTATVSPSNATNQKVTFSSSNPAVATADAKLGTVTAVANGEAVITATTEEGGKTANCTVTVSIPHVHDYDTSTWKSDENNHWHECKANDGAKIDVAAHSDADKNGKCDVCGYDMEVPPVTYTVTFDANGGSGTMDALTVNEGTACVLPSCSFTAPEGKEFKAWEVNGAQYATGSSCTITADTVAKAVWKEIAAVTFTATVQNGSGSGNYEAGQTVSIVAASMSGYTFDQWIVVTGGVTLTDRNASTTTFTMPSSNVIVQATYTRDESGSSGGGSWGGGSSGSYVKPSNTAGRWKQLSDGTKQYLENNKPVTGWKTIESKQYYFNSNGIMQTGWLKDGGHWYYLQDDGTVGTGWVKVDKTWYHLGNSGIMDTGWLKLDNVWYYLKPGSGAMATGWLKDGNTWFWFQDWGGMVHTNWAQINDTWYYFNGGGAMITGWLQRGSNWYYLQSDGAMAVNKWLHLNDKWYYVGADGAMYQNCKTPDGYNVNRLGSLIP